MPLNIKPILLLSVVLLLAWSVAGCRPTAAPRMTNTTLSPSTDPSSSNSTLPADAVPSDEVPSDAAMDDADQPSAEQDGTGQDDTKQAATDSTSDVRSDASRRRAREQLLLGTPGKVDPTTRTRPIPKPQPGKTLDLTFDDLKFNIQPDAPFERSMLPKEIEDLHGQKIRIGGYILPSFSNRDIKQFVLVRDNMECCFGPGAALYDSMLVEMEGRGVDFTVRPIVVEGVFHVKEYVIDGRHMAIYQMQGLEVQ